jgi:flavodoxin
MKIVTFFFSGTGNTWWTAKKITDIFIELGHSAVYCSIDKNMSVDCYNRIEEFDIVGFAYPIYGANFPPIFKLFIEDLISKRSYSCSKPCFTLCTIGYVNALGPFVAGKIFRKAHFKLIGSLNIKLSNNASIPHFRTNVLNGCELETLKAKALKKLQNMQ